MNICGPLAAVSAALTVAFGVFACEEEERGSAKEGWKPPPPSREQCNGRGDTRTSGSDDTLAHGGRRDSQLVVAGVSAMTGAITRERF